MIKRECIVEVYNLNKSYKKKKVNEDISISIKSNKISCIAGFNGSGKTTLLKQIVGIEKSDSGKILIKGIDINEDRNIITRNISYQPQNVSNIFRGLKVKEAIYYTGVLRGLSKIEAKKQMNKIIELFKINDLSEKLISYLSGGEKQLVSISMTLIGDNPVLIFDEPTNNLDPERKQLFIKELLRLKEIEKKSIIMITHDLSEFENVIDEIIVLHNGKILAQQSPNEICKDFNTKIKIFIKSSFNTNVDEIKNFANGHMLNKFGENYFYIAEKSELDNLLKIYKEVYMDKFGIELCNLSLQDRLLYFISNYKRENNNE